jgi:hypothetical protein
MFIDLSTIVVFAAMIIAGLVSARITLMMSREYGLIERLRDWFPMVLLLGTSIPGFIAWFVAYAAVSYGGLFYGVLADLLMLPAIGAVWFALLASVWFLNFGVVAGVDRIFNGLAKKLDAIG